MLPVVVLAFSASVVTALLLIYLGSEHRYFGGSQDDVKSVQAAHVRPTPRTGGLAVAAGILAAFSGSVWFDLGTSETLLSFGLLLLAMVPVFVAGVVEDTMRHIPTKVRYLSAVISATLAIVITGTWIPHANLGALDLLLAYPAFGIVLTVFLIASFAHAFNLIDGLNGLAGGVGLIAALSLIAVALKANVPEVIFISSIVAAAIAGFLVFNFPLGRIFLGDAGAYVLGFILPWCAVILFARNPEVSGWSVLLIFFWPMADTVFAMVRRISNGNRFDEPDRLHFHQLVMRSLEIFVIGRGRRTVSNPLASAVLMPLIATPAVVGVLFWDDRMTGSLALIGFSVLFIGSYNLGLKVTSRRGLQVKPKSRPQPVSQQMSRTRPPRHTLTPQSSSEF